MRNKLCEGKVLQKAGPGRFFGDENHPVEGTPDSSSVDPFAAQRELEKLRAEKLELEQSLFESERYAGFLAAQRQKLLDEQLDLQQQNKKLKAMAARPSARVMNLARRLMQRLKRV